MSDNEATAFDGFILDVALFVSSPVSASLKPNRLYANPEKALAVAKVKFMMEHGQQKFEDIEKEPEYIRFIMKINNDWGNK